MAKRVRLNRGGGSYFAAPKTDLRFIPSGCKMLDLALGGGWVRGRCANIVGDKSTGKTLLCIEASANFVRLDKRAKVRYREAESAFDENYAKALGMPIDSVDFGEPMETIEDFFEDLQKIIKGARGPELVILDSLDALSDRGEMDRDMNEGSYGVAKPKLLSQLFRRTVRQMEDKDVTLIIVSQVRDKIGAMFGRKTTRSGGRALDFYASQVAYLAHIQTLTRKVQNTNRPSGVVVRAKMDKNKVALPFREAEFPILFGWGVDDITACLNWLKEVKGLKDVDLAANLSDKEIASHSLSFMNGDPEEYREELAKIHAAVTERWYSIEQSVLPTRSKYGD